MSTEPLEFEHDDQFRAVFRHYKPRLLGFFGRRGFSTEDSLDLTQETFISVYKGLEGVRSESALPNWIFTVAANIYRNELRRRSTTMRQATVLSLDGDDRQGPIVERIPGDESSSLDRVLEDERSRLLYEAVNDLPARMRQCVMLRIDQGLKYREIAAVLRISVETVKVQLFQARQRLRKILDEHFADIVS